MFSTHNHDNHIASFVTSMAHDGPKDPSSWVDSNFALFVLADVSNDVSSRYFARVTTDNWKEINKVIQQAYDGSTVNCYMYWLADDYSNAPRETPTPDGESTQTESGTEPPIAKD